MRNAWLAAALLAGVLAGPAAAQQQGSLPRPAGAASPFIDVHAHPDPADPRRSVLAALDAMPAENAARIVLMPPPFTARDRGRYDAEVFLAAARNHPDRLTVLGGGGTLNAMIQESAATGDAGPEVRRRFRRRAEELLRHGAAGFGELTAEHFEGATPYQAAPPDHPLLLLLADIAAEHRVPIDLHMEAVPQEMPLPPALKSPPNPARLHANIAAFERLLAHNARARIIWAHAGWDNTGFRTAELCRRLLGEHPNLYMDIKIDPFKPGMNSPLSHGASGSIRPEWLDLFRDFPDRFLIGTDQHYPEPPAATQRWEPVARLLDQLPEDVRRMIAVDNARRLYPAAPGGARQPDTGPGR